MFKHVIDSVSTTVGDRLRNPLIGAFIVSWVLSNWRFLIILSTSDKKGSERVEEVEAHLSIGISFLTPLCLALAISLIFPWLARWLSGYNYTILKGQRKSNARHDHEVESEKLELEKDLIQKRKTIAVETRALAELSESAEVLADSFTKQLIAAEQGVSESYVEHSDKLKEQFEGKKEELSSLFSRESENIEKLKEDLLSSHAATSLNYDNELKEKISDARLEFQQLLNEYREKLHDEIIPEKSLILSSGGLESKEPSDDRSEDDEQQLELKPMDKGRFANTDPVMVDGENLDVPTFMRKK